MRRLENLYVHSVQRAQFPKDYSNILTHFENSFPPASRQSSFDLVEWGLIWRPQHETDSSKAGGKALYDFLNTPYPWPSETPQGPVPALRGHCKFYIWSCAEEGVPPPCKNIWTPLINRAQRNASPMVRADIKSKQLPRTYQLLCWFCPAQVMVLLFVNRRLAGQGAGRKCDLLHLVAENREYN